MKNKIAVIDLGSQTFRLAIITFDDHSFNVEHSRLKDIRLSEGLQKTGVLSDDAMNRGLKAIYEFKNLIETYNVKKIIAAGTHPFRFASNAEYFLEKCKNSGISIKVLSELEEAVISSEAALFSLSLNNAIVIDIGGGSTEISFFKDNMPEKFLSFPVGAVNLKEKLYENNISSHNIKNNPEFFYEKAFDGLIDKFEDISLEFPFNKAIATGGAATTITHIHLGLEKYDPVSVRGINFGKDELDFLWNKILSLSGDEISKKFVINSRRSDIIHSGLFILKKIFKCLSLETVTITDAGLLMGLMIKYIKKECPDVKLPHPCCIYL